MGLPVTAKQDEVSGIPIPQLRAFYDAIGDAPVVLDLEAFVQWQGKGTRATGHIGPFSVMGERKERLTRVYTIQYDDWAEMPGCDDAGPEAVETVLSALGACIINMTSWHAARMGVVLDDLSVKVKMSFDAQGFFQNTDQTDKFSAVQYEIRIKATGATKKQLNELANIGRNCPVCRMLAKPMVLKSKIFVEH
jgi:uncharacterized OsmC-like protein